MLQTANHAIVPTKPPDSPFHPNTSSTDPGSSLLSSTTSLGRRYVLADRQREPDPGSPCHSQSSSPSSPDPKGIATPEPPTPKSKTEPSQTQTRKVLHQQGWVVTYCHHRRYRPIAGASRSTSRLINDSLFPMCQQPASPDIRFIPNNKRATHESGARRGGGIGL
jgi:hypothetical protein